MRFEKETRGGVGERWRFGEEGGVEGEGCSAVISIYLPQTVTSLHGTAMRRESPVPTMTRNEDTWVAGHPVSPAG